MSDDELTPAEARVRELLRSLAGAPPAQPGTALVPHVVRTARWQRAVRGAVQRRPASSARWVTGYRC